VLHSREVHDRAGGWTDGLPRHGDVDLWLRCRAAGARIGFLREPTVIRFPSYIFANAPEGRGEALHARFADELDSGRLVLDDLRWPIGRRVLGWAEDVVVVGRARGPRWTRMLLRRVAR
jgi:hypothetical protein